MDPAPPPAPRIRGLSALWQAPTGQREYDIVIVGSGYGGSMAAAVLAGCTVADANGAPRPVRIALLERGLHRLPGEFPSRLAQLPGELRIAHTDDGTVTGNREGLFDVRLGPDVATLVGNGLGGGSLINAGVLVAPQPDQLRLPGFRATVQALIDDGHYARAGRELGARVRAPDGQEIDNSIERHGEHQRQPLDKAVALRHLAGPQALGPALISPPVAVAMADEANAAGVQLNACNLCGDCLTGCNVGAKNSLDVALLQRAWDAGAENLSIFTGASVTRVCPAPAAPSSADAGTPAALASGWQVVVEHTRGDLQARHGEPLILQARRVILAAGALGSTEILLRSQEAGLAVSSALGSRFSCNGDNIAAVQGLPRATRGNAEEGEPLAQRRIGPTITQSVAMAGEGRGARPFLLQEFAVPGALHRLFGEIVTTARALHSLTADDASDHAAQAPSAVDPAAVDPAAMRHTLLLGVIGHDDAEGRLALPEASGRAAPAAPGTLRIDWPGARHGAALQASHAAVHRCVRDAAPHTDDAAAPVLVPNPLWRPLPEALSGLVSTSPGPVLTVHPLGGCPMGADAQRSAVNELGQVYCGSASGQGVYEGLVVMDGAVVPESLGANPALTIAALALRAAEALRDRWGLSGGLHLGRQAVPAGTRGRVREHRQPMAVPPSPAPAHTAVEIVERLRGTVWLRRGWAPPRPWILELTLAYEPAPLSALAVPLARRLIVASDHPQTRLRLFDATTWEARGLAGLDDAQRERFATLQAQLSGHLDVLHREPSFALQRRARALLAWLRNRGGRDLWAWALQRWRSTAAAASGGNAVRELWHLASRAGEVRRFDYCLRLGPIIGSPAAADPLQADVLGGLREGEALLGCKRLTYACAGNPWRQLTEMRLLRMPGLQADRDNRLVLDPRFLAHQGFPMLRVVQQADQVSALVDLAALGLTLTRLIASLHLWTFRLPDAPGPQDPPRPVPAQARLPGPLASGQHPEITWLQVHPGATREVDAVQAERAMRDGAGDALVRLARYRGPEPSLHPPLVMIHGYSVSGNTFTHPSIRPSAAQWFCANGREVWVVDLRTSAALPGANLPWSLEEVGQVDIPAALLHIQATTGQRVDVLAHCVGAVMLSYALLSDAQALQRVARERLEPCPLEPAALAQLAAFNGAGGAGQPHPVVRRVILSQKGPVLRYTDANVLRGWVMQFARRWLLREGWTFEPSANASWREQMLDRLLASLPYPDADWAVENPAAPWKRTPWTASRHRMDALYGRDFNAERMTPQTLSAIDELFGPMNLQTVAQTIAFTRHDAITDRDGRGDFVTRARLRQRWSGIPTLAVHGQDNGLVDVWTQRLLAAHLGAAGVPFEALTRPGGHQDLLIGRDTEALWAAMAAFLERPLKACGPDSPALAMWAGALPSALQDADPGPWIDVPWVGPRIDILDGQARVAAMASPAAGRARLMLVPLLTGSPAALHPSAAWGAGQTPPAPSHLWQFALAPPAHDTPDLHGWLALMVTDTDEGREPALDAWWRGLNGAAPVVPARRPPRALRAAVAHWLSGPEATRALSMAVVPRQALEAYDVRTAAPATAVMVGLGSCQYPSGLVDTHWAQRSLQRLADRAAAATAPHEGAGTTPRVDLVLLLGDQIYADATAGLVDPTRAEERYAQPHEQAQRAHGLRSLMTRVPVVMALDDHELIDNWEPRPAGAPDASGLWAQREQSRGDGTRAFWHWARARPKPLPVPPVTDTAFQFAGVPVLLCDTRLGRSARVLDPTQARILQPWQFDALCDWLLAHREQTKIVATPSLLLPRRREVAHDAAQWPRSDAWDGFPASLHRLLDFLRLQRIGRTIFVSGDEHHALACEAWLHDSGAPIGAGVKVVAVHASALHAPFPFANGRPEELSTTPFVTPGGTAVQMRLTTAPPGDGFAVLAITPGDDDVDLTFVKADGRSQTHRLGWADRPQPAT